jgi:hypothetical protein
MQTPARSQTWGVTRTWSSSGFFRHLGLVFGGLMAGGLMFCGQTVRAERIPTLTVLVYNYTEATPATLMSAERDATRILHLAGANIAWVNCWDKKQLSADSGELCAKGWTSQTPGLRLISGANKFQDAEFGAASIPAYITIYYDKVARRAHEDNSASELSTLLGCVMTHELGHLLLNDPRHSRSGIMQAQIGSRQIQQALTGRLLFTKDQARIIREQVLTAMNR